MISVSVSGLVKCFGDTVALGGVSLRIEAGELFFLLGPSGCGKTTLLRSLAGFSDPDEGQIFFGEDEVTHLEAHKRRTAMMFQSYALWPHMSVWDNVAFGLQQLKVPSAEIGKRVAQVLEAVRMEDYGRRKPAQLSGGQQQRVALARALVVRPRCLLLDEPLSNLDAKLRTEMRHEIRRVCKEFKLTAIYVTHDQKEALSVADRIAVLDKGHILQVGTPREVYRRPVDRFVADFIGETNFISGTVINSGAGMCLVETSFGELSGVSSTGDDIEPGKKVTVCIRPECVRLEDMPVEENGLSGSLENPVFYGESAQYEVVTGGGKITATELNPRFLSRIGEDEEVFAWVDPEDVVVLVD